MNQAMLQRCSPVTRCGSSASRSPPWSPRRCTRARTRSTRRRRLRLPACGREYERRAVRRAGTVVPRGRDNVICTFGDASAADADLFEGCEVVASETIQNTRVAPAPMESRADRRRLGRGRRLTAWIPNQGAQGTKGRRRRARVAPDQVRIITPDVGGGFGAKFGADAEMWSPAGSRSSSAGPAMVGDAHGELARHDPRPGPAAQDHYRRLKDGTVLAYRLEIIQDCGAYPKSGAFLPSLTILMTPGPTTSRAPRPGPLRGHQHHADWRLPWCGTSRGRRRDRPGHGPVRRRRRGRPGRGAPQEPATQVHRAARTAFGAVYDSGDYVTGLRRPWPRPTTRGCSPSRPSAAPTATRSSSVSGCRPTWRSPGRRRGWRAERERHRRGSPRWDATV